MKVRRILALVLSAALAVTALTACTSAKDEASQKSADNQTATLSYDTVKIGVIHIGNPADGSGYTYAHDQGIVGMQKELGLKDDQIVRKNNVSDSDPAATETAIRECIEEGCNIIFGTSWGYMDKMESLAEEYPDVYFCHGTGYKNNGKNLNNYFGRIYQARYLTGIVAGMKTESNLIGYVSAMGSENSECTGGIDAFAMGVYSVNPDAKVYVKVTNSWYSPTEETNAAKALLSEGCDVIAQHCDTPNPQLEAESAGKWGVGYNTDMSKDAPKATLTSTLWNWSAYYTYQVKQIVDQGIQVAIVTGGGNFWRGRTSETIDRTKADQIGMLATVMNCIYVSDIFRHVGMKTEVFTPFVCGAFTSLFSKDAAVEALNEGKVIFFAGGTGHPYFSTDTGAVLRAIEIEADAMLLAKAIDGIYDSDPKVNPEAKKYDEISIQEIIDKKLMAVDLTASIMCLENKMPMLVFGLNEENSIVETMSGNFNGTKVTV